MWQAELDALEWSVRPWDHDRHRGYVALVLAAAASGAAWFWGGPALGIFGIVVTFGGMGPFFVRTRYRLTPESVAVSSWFLRVERPWSAFRRLEVGRRSVRLSPYSRRHPLDAYRAVLLHFGEQRDAVLDRVRVWSGIAWPEGS